MKTINNYFLVSEINEPSKTTFELKDSLSKGTVVVSPTDDITPGETIFYKGGESIMLSGIGYILVKGEDVILVI